MRSIPGTENIYKLPGKKEKYGIRKKIKGKSVHFGTGYSVDEAIYIRDWCKSNNWKKKYPCLARRLNFEEDYEIIDRIVNERSIKPKTKESYVQAIDHYTEFLNQSFTSLVELYLKEEENIVWKKRSLKNHLIGYHNYVYANYLKSTAKIYFSKLLTILRHLEIEISYLPKFNDKNVKDLPPITYSDLLVKEELEKAYVIANPVMRAIILFQSSSGCARRETLNLTVKDYLEANNIRVFNKPVKSLLLKVNPEEVPTFKLLRQKTNKYYFTYCSPQANKEILEYLINRDNLTLESHLFDCNLYYWNSYFMKINDELELGTCRKYNRFRSHMLRKFHASTLYNNGMGMDDVDSLQGRGKDSTHQSYFMEDPELLKKKYLNYMDCLLLEV